MRNLILSVVLVGTACAADETRCDPECAAGSVCDRGVCRPRCSATIPCFDGTCVEGVCVIAICGNGVVESPESCDGDCPTQCIAEDPCVELTLVGSVAACTARCEATPLEQCTSGDGCCPAGCAGVDDDCVAGGDPGGAGDPGAGDPGAGDPGAGDPGAGDPGAGDPGAGDPGAGDPGAGDPGCFGTHQVVYGPRTPDAATSEPDGGTIAAWENEIGILADGGGVAETEAMIDYQVSDWLIATRFGFAIPANATITGVTVEWDRDVTMANNIVDEAVELASSLGTSENRADPNEWSASGLMSYGGSEDLWGLALTPQTVNQLAFGARIKVLYDSFAGNGRARLDYVQITVTTDEPCP